MSITASIQHDVFISYSSEDRSFAEAVCDALEAEKITCWIACRSILPSQDWAEAIENAIAGARLMVVVFSGASLKAEYLKNEVERALSLGRRILPLRIEVVEPSGALAYLFALRHWFDALPPPVEGHLDRLVKTVQTLLASPDYAPQRTDGGADPRADATTTRPGASRDSQRRPRKGEGLRRPGLLWAAGAVLAAALIAMVALLALWFASHRNALPPATEIGLLSGDGARLGAEPIMEIGDSFRVEVEPDEAGYLAILQVTSDGDLFEVPVCDDAARGGKRLRIEPRTRYELPRGLPQGYRLTPPAGAELLIVATAADAAGLDAAMDRLKAETRRVAFPIGVPADILAKAATRGKIEIGADDEAQAKIRAVRRLSEELLGKDRVLIIWNLPPPKKDRLPGLE